MLNGVLRTHAQLLKSVLDTAQPVFDFVELHAKYYVYLGNTAAACYCESDYRGVATSFACGEFIVDTVSNRAKNSQGLEVRIRIHANDKRRFNVFVHNVQPIHQIDLCNLKPGVLRQYVRS